MPKRLSILIPLLFCSSIFLGQSKQPNIAFDTDYFNAVDHWVVLPKNPTDPFYLLGYIYLEGASGLTFVFETTLTIGTDYKWRTFTSLKNFVFKRTLDKTTPLIHVLSTKEIKEVQLPIQPGWLRLYDDADKSVEGLSSKGMQYNAIGKSNLALPYLENAYRQNPKARTVAFELAYAYNATKQFQKAIPILKDALQYDSGNYKLYRELGFSLIQIQKIEEAESIYEQGIKCCPDETQKREMAIDMAQTFYQLKDINKFEKWKLILKEFIKE